MFSAYLVVAILLSVGLVMSGAPKLAKNPRIVEGIGGLGVPLPLFPLLAALEIAGAAGLIIGVWFRSTRHCCRGRRGHVFHRRRDYPSEGPQPRIRIPVGSGHDGGCRRHAALVQSLAARALR